MSEIEIKNHSFPTRCEICHQADQYDPASDSCRRCDSLKLHQLTSANDSNATGSDASRSGLSRYISWRDITAFVIAVLTGYYTGDQLMRSYIVAIIVWLYCSLIFTLILCAVAERQRILAGIIFHSAVTVGSLMVMAHGRDLLELAVTLREGEKSSLMELWLIGVLISTVIAHCCNWIHVIIDRQIKNFSK